MLIKSDKCANDPELDWLFSRNPPPLIPQKAQEALRSHLILGFEEAMTHGLSPMEALGCILSWVGAEMGRIPSSQTQGRNLPGAA